MQNLLGVRIQEYRESLKFTPEQLGARYGIAAPAIVRFEKGRAKPPLELWVKIGRDLGFDERRSVLLWIKAQLPAKYRRYVEPSAGVAEEEASYGQRRHGLDYTTFTDRAAMRRAALQDDDTPRGLKALLRDDEFWTLLKPTGEELNVLRDVFGGLGEGSAGAYREALRLIREFMKPAD